jgi:hypothetical protein
VPRELILALVLGGVVVFFTLAIRHANRIEQRAVAAARRLLPNHVREGLAHRFTGHVRGAEVTLRLFQKSGRTAGGPWAEVLVPQPPGVLLELREQDAIETRLAAKGLARDAELGDPAFDQAFVVEMAPARLAAAVFDQDLRRRLLELRPVRVTPRKNGGLSLEKRGWEDDRFAALIEAGALLNARLSQSAASEAGQARRGGASHEAARDAERSDLEKVRAARVSWNVRNALIVCGGLLLFLVFRLMLS